MDIKTSHLNKHQNVNAGILMLQWRYKIPLSQVNELFSH